MLKKKRSTKKRPYSRILKKVLGWLHLWLGLISGTVIVTSMLAASVFTWEEELTNWWYADLVYHNNPGNIHKPASELLEAVRKAYPTYETNRLVVGPDINKNWSFRFYKNSKNPGWTYLSSIEYDLLVFINPYTGEVSGHIDYKQDWIYLAAILHKSLLLNFDIGTHIVSVSVLIIIILALTGLYLWWPKNIKALGSRLTIKWKAKFKRINWDVHSVGGFYTYIFILIFAGTGLFFSYSWWKEGTIYLLGDNIKTAFYRPANVPLNKSDNQTGIDIAFNDALQRRENWRLIRFTFPMRGSEKGKVRAAIKFNDKNSWWAQQDDYYYHPETGKVIGTNAFEEKSIGQKYRISNYEMHVGRIYGLPTKIIAFIATLFIASLPITGFIIWWGRGKKKPKKSPIQGLEM